MLVNIVNDLQATAEGAMVNTTDTLLEASIWLSDKQLLLTRPTCTHRTCLWCMGTCTHTYIHTYTHAHKHRHTHTHASTDTHTCAHTHKLTFYKYM